MPPAYILDWRKASFMVTLDVSMTDIIAPSHSYREPFDIISGTKLMGQEPPTNQLEVPFGCQQNFVLQPSFASPMSPSLPPFSQHALKEGKNPNSRIQPLYLVRRQLCLVIRNEAQLCSKSNNATKTNHHQQQNHHETPQLSNKHKAAGRILDRIAGAPVSALHSGGKAPRGFALAPH